MHRCTVSSRAPHLVSLLGRTPYAPPNRTSTLLRRPEFLASTRIRPLKGFFNLHSVFFSSQQTIDSVEGIGFIQPSPSGISLNS